MSMRPTHIAKPDLVHADEILNLCRTKDGINLILASGRTVDLELLSGSPIPAIGDYLMTGDGYTYVMPRRRENSYTQELYNAPGLSDGAPSDYDLRPLPRGAAT
jgi:hypothetical protein